MKKKRTVRPHKVAAAPKAVSPSLVFSARDGHHHPKNQLWYLGIGLLLLAILVAFYQTQEYLLMVVVVALAAAVFRLANVPSSDQEIRLNERGVTLGKNFYAFFQLKAFWVAETTGSASVYIERVNLSPTIHFIIPEGRIEELVEFMSDHLPWHTHKSEPLSDRLARLLRF